MNLGLSMPTFTLLHVVISLIAIISGVVFFGALVRRHWLSGWNTTFLITTIATSVTGFLFSPATFGPSEVIGIISLAVLLVAVIALYSQQRSLRWVSVYKTTALFALYLNLFVGVVQAFQKIPALHAIAPTQSEAPFIAAQIVLLLVVVGTGYFAIFRHPPATPMSRAVAR